MGKRHLLVMVLIALLGLVPAACMNTDGDDEDMGPVDDAATGDNDDVETLDLDTWEPHSPELDLQTLMASGPEGTYEATRHENSYVGDVNNELFVSVSFDGSYPAQSADEVTVYLCDGDDTQLFLSGEATPETTILSNDDTRVELMFDENADTVTGTVQLGDDESQPFEAVPADEHAGLYTAQLTAQEVDFWAGWVVLNDGRQQGLSCCCSFIDGVPPGCYSACCVLN